MEKQKNTLQCASAFFLGMVIMDICDLVRKLAGGALDINTSVSGMSEAGGKAVVAVALIAVLAITSIGTILKLFLAVKGLRQASGNGGKGRAHITWAKIMAVLLVIGIVGTIVNIKNGDDNWYTLISPAASLIAAYFYITSANALKRA